MNKNEEQFEMKNVTVFKNIGYKYG